LELIVWQKEAASNVWTYPICRPKSKSNAYWISQYK